MGRWKGIIIPDFLPQTSEGRTGDRDGNEKEGRKSTENTGYKFMGYCEMVQVYLWKVSEAMTH